MGVPAKHCSITDHFVKEEQWYSFSGGVERQGAENEMPKASRVRNRAPEAVRVGTPQPKEMSKGYDNIYTKTERRLNILITSFVLSVQHHSHRYSNNGNVVPVRSWWFLKLETAFPRVLPRNDPCALRTSIRFVARCIVSSLFVIWPVGRFGPELEKNTVQNVGP